MARVQFIRRYVSEGTGALYLCEMTLTADRPVAEILEAGAADADRRAAAAGKDLGHRFRLMTEFEGNPMEVIHAE
jgi:hypothetical protein